MTKLPVGVGSRYRRRRLTEFNPAANVNPVLAAVQNPPSGDLGLRMIGTLPRDRAGRRYGNKLQLQGAILGSDGIRTMLGLGALAALGAVEIAVAYGVVGSMVELVFGMDLPLIGLVQSSDRSSSSGCT